LDEKQMRAREFIRESNNEKLDQSFRDSSPGAASYPSALNPYKRYRLGMAAAGAPDYEHDFCADGPSEDFLVSVHYSVADEEIMKAAHKKTGHKPKTMAPKNSHESDYINKVSPVPDWIEK
jgi:hypothetical protein